MAHCVRSNFHGYLPLHWLAVIRDCSHASISAKCQAVVFSANLIGAGNVPFFTHAQMLEPDTPKRALSCGRR